jgi:hypothetical protein
MFRSAILALIGAGILLAFMAKEGKRIKPVTI